MRPLVYPRSIISLKSNCYSHTPRNGTDDFLTFEFKYCSFSSLRKFIEFEASKHLMSFSGYKMRYEKLLIKIA